MADNQWLTGVVDEVVEFIEGKIHRRVSAHHRISIRNAIATTCFEGARLPGGSLKEEITRRQKEEATREP